MVAVDQAHLVSGGAEPPLSKRSQRVSQRSRRGTPRDQGEGAADPGTGSARPCLNGNGDIAVEICSEQILQSFVSWLKVDSGGLHAEHLRCGGAGGRGSTSAIIDAVASGRMLRPWEERLVCDYLHINVARWRVGAYAPSVIHGWTLKKSKSNSNRWVEVMLTCKPGENRGTLAYHGTVSVAASALSLPRLWSGQHGDDAFKAAIKARTPEGYCGPVDDVYPSKSQEMWHFFGGAADGIQPLQVERVSSTIVAASSRVEPNRQGSAASATAAKYNARAPQADPLQAQQLAQAPAASQSAASARPVDSARGSATGALQSAASAAPGDSAAGATTHTVAAPLACGTATAGASATAVESARGSATGQSAASATSGDSAAAPAGTGSKRKRAQMGGAAGPGNQSVGAAGSGAAGRPGRGRGMRGGRGRGVRGPDLRKRRRAPFVVRDEEDGSEGPSEQQEQEEDRKDYHTTHNPNKIFSVRMNGTNGRHTKKCKPCYLMRHRKCDFQKPCHSRLTYGEPCEYFEPPLAPFKELLNNFDLRCKARTSCMACVIRKKPCDRTPGACNACIVRCEGLNCMYVVDLETGVFPWPSSVPMGNTLESVRNFFLEEHAKFPTVSCALLEKPGVQCLRYADSLTLPSSARPWAFGDSPNTKLTQFNIMQKRRAERAAADRQRSREAQARKVEQRAHAALTALSTPDLAGPITEQVGQPHREQFLRWFAGIGAATRVGEDHLRALEFAGRDTFDLVSIDICHC